MRFGGNEVGRVVCKQNTKICKYINTVAKIKNVCAERGLMQDTRSINIFLFSLMVFTGETNYESLPLMCI